MNTFFRKLDAVVARYDELGRLMSDPNVNANPKQFQLFAKEHSDLGEVVELYKAYRKKRDEYEGARELLLEKDAEMRGMAELDIARLEPELAEIEAALKVALLPKDPNDEKNVILEIRAGTGGEEASLFAMSLLRMYTRYAERRGWRVDLMSSSETGLGGMKEAVLNLSGNKVYSRLKFEAGVHRVQRVPETEAQGRVHTSACTVAVLPEAEDVEFHIAEKDLRIDVFRSSGPGGQSVNTTDSAVRITHIPTGVSVSCQDEKSQLKNKVKAMKILRSRLLDHAIAEQHATVSAQRKEMVGSGDRSAKIRTYNFPQSRLTDHRIGLTIYNLQSVMEGELDQVIDPLITHYQSELLKGESTAGKG